MNGLEPILISLRRLCTACRPVHGNGSRALCAALTLLLPVLTAGAQTASTRFANTRIAVEKGDLTLDKRELQVTFDLDLGALTLPASRRIVLTPVVKNGDETRCLPAAVVNGRRKQIAYRRKENSVRYKDATVSRRYNGTEQTVHYTASVPYEAWMENADVVLLQDVCGCGDLLSSDRLPVWRWRHPAVAYIRPEATLRTYTLQGSAHIDFPVDKTTLYPDYGNNLGELSRLLQTIENIKQDDRVTITGIEICGWASPESPYAHNEYLARARAEALKRYVSGLLHLDEALFAVSFVPENWSGLRELVQESDLPHKATVLRLIDEDTPDLDVKEARIKAACPQDYAFMLARFYPALRRSDYTVTYTVRPLTVEEVMAQWKRDPHLLTLEALYLVAQRYDPGSRPFDELFALAVHLFPDDPVANLNVACAAVARGAFDEAEAYLSKAGDTPYAWNAEGVIAARKGALEQAARLFQRAADSGLATAAENLRLVGETY